MSDRVIVIIRWSIFLSAVVCLLQATVLYPVVQRWLVTLFPIAREREDSMSARIWRDSRFQRGWPIFMSALFFLLWWYLGTTAGVAVLHSVGW